MLTLLVGDAVKNREKLVDLLCDRLNKEDPKVKYIVKEPLLRTKIQELLTRKGIFALAPNPILTRDVIFRGKEESLHPALQDLYLLQIIEKERENLELLNELSIGSLVSSVSRFFRELRVARISPEAFKENLNGRLKTPKNHDLHLLYKAYTDFVKTKGFREVEEVLWKALDTLYFSSDETVILDGFYNLDPFDEALIQKLLTLNVDLYINYPYVADSEAFEALETGYRFLKKQAGKVLVSSPRQIGDVKVFQAQTPKQEAQYVLKTIKKLFWEQKITHADDIVILTNNPKIYRPIFARMCEAEEIDFRPGPVSLNQTAVVKEINTLIAYLTRPLEKEEFRALLLSKYFDFEYFLKEISQVEIVTFLNQIRLNGTSDLWSRRLKRLQNKSIESKQLLKALEALQEIVDWGQKKLQASSIAQSFLELLEKLKVYDNLFLTASFDPYQILELRAFVEAKEHLLNLAEQVQDETFTVSEFLKSWSYSLDYSRLTVTKDGISVHSINEAPLIESKYVFVVGLSEDEFPAKALEKWSFKDEERELLNQDNIYRMSLSKDQEKLQDYLYWESIRCGSGVYLSSPAESNGHYKEKSRYIDELYEFGLEELPEEPQVEPLITTQNEYMEYVVQDPKNLKTLPQALQDSILDYQNYANEKYTCAKLGYQKGAYKKTLSVTAFDEYLDCPYRFFVHNLLGLRKEEILSEEVSSLEGGSLWHKVLELYYKDLLDQTPPYRFDTERYDNIVYNVFEKSTASEFYQKVEMEKYYENVKRYIKDDLNRTNFTPKLLEVRFGDKKQPVLQVGPYILKGMIDRVDFIYGEVENDSYLEGYFITDYKRSQSSLESAKASNNFQLIAYILALKEAGSLPILGAKFQCLTGDETHLWSKIACKLFNRRGFRTKTQEDFENDIRDRLKRAEEKAIELLNGVYAPNYTSTTCRYCSFMDLCQRPTRKGEEDAD